MMKYKRLTERRGNVIVDNCKNCDNVSSPMGCTEHCCYEVMKNRLAELEDKIEQGTLIELPCKVGDTVYVIARMVGAGYPDPVWVYEINEECFDLYHLDIWDKWAFASREKAEKRLKELQE